MSLSQKKCVACPQLTSKTTKLKNGFILDVHTMVNFKEIKL